MLIISMNCDKCVIGSDFAWAVKIILNWKILKSGQQI